MSLCKSGEIQNCCHPNALLTLQEYLQDYASAKTREIGEKLIEEEMKKVPREKVRETATKYLDLIKNQGQRDFRF